MRSALAIVLTLLAWPARADDDTTTIVTGLRLPRPLRDVPATVTVVSRDEIERSPKRTADDLVRTVPSAATFRRSSSLVADPTSQGANLRGLGPSGVSRALVLQDGVPLNDPFGGWVYWRAIPLLGVDRVEVSPGGASALFGNFALGGVVQIFSRRADEARLEAVASTGSLRTHRGAVRASDRIGASAVVVDADVLDSAGYAPIAPGDRGAVDGPASSAHVVVGGRVEHRAGGSLVRAHARYFDESLAAGTRFTTADVTTGSYGATWTTAGAGILEIAVFGGHQRFAQTRARVSEDRSDAELASRQRVPSTSQGASATWTSDPVEVGARGGEHTFLAGVDLLRVDGTSHETIVPAMTTPESVVAKSAGGEQRSLGLFAGDAVRLARGLDVTAALRVDLWQNVDGRRTTTRESGDEMVVALPSRTDAELSPRLGVLRRVGEIALRASVFRAYRAPTLNELYRSFQVGTVLTEANDALRAETLWGGEAGAEAVVETVIARVTGFWNELDDPVQNVTLAEPLPGGATRQRQNLGHARVRGVEVEASWRPARAWIVTAGFTFVDAEVTAAPANPDLVGKRLAQDPRHRATATLTFDDPSIAMVTAQVRYLGDQYEDDLNTLPMAGFTLVDAIAARRLTHGLSVFVAVENLLDERYLVGRAGVDTIGAPRMIQVGLSYDSDE